MSKIVKQYRYYGNDNNLNHPKDTINLDSLESGQIFVLESDVSAPIIGLGIQTIPGIKFRLNGDEGGEPIVIGASGIYELEIQNNYEIKMLQFEEEPLNQLINTRNNNAYLIIDIIYETGD